MFSHIAKAARRISESSTLRDHEKMLHRHIASREYRRICPSNPIIGEMRSVLKAAK